MNKLEKGKIYPNAENETPVNGVSSSVVKKLI